MIVAVIGEKGGTGKTTFAVHLACWRVISGRDVMLIDADRQGSASIWIEIRQESSSCVPTSVQKFGRGLRGSVIDLSRRYDDIIVDIGAGDGPAMESILRIADFAVIPFQPSEMDIWTADLLNSLAGEAKEINDDLEVTAVLNRAPAHRTAKDVRAALDALRSCPELTTSDCVVRERTSIRRAVPNGRLIDEWRPRDQKGLDELAQIYTLVFDESPPIQN